MKIKLITKTPPSRSMCGPSVTDEDYDNLVAGEVVEVREGLAQVLIEIGMAVEAGGADGN